MSRFKLVCQYDGSNFYGWQLQKDKRTVQGELEEAITKLNKGELVHVVGSGRTDAGVHALGQVANINIDSNMDTKEFMNAVYGNIGYDINILASD